MLKLFASFFILSDVVMSANPSISTDLYNKFVRYTEFSAAAYSSDCTTPPNGATVANYFDISSTDTQGYLFRDDAAEELILAFRGTSDVADFVDDFNQTLVPYVSVGVDCSACEVHGGYLASWNSASDQVIAAIDTQMDAHEGYALTVTGHSLGAGLAALASMSLASASIGLNVTTYTFGQPRTGNPAWANYVDSVLPAGKMFRVTHSNDGVPQTITTADGFRHHSTEYWEMNDTFDAADTVQCSGQEPPDCNNSVRGTGLGANLTGINAAHLKYSGIEIGNPLDPGLDVCSGLY